MLIDLIIKSKKKSPELEILTSLINRMTLSEKYQSRHFTLQKGYEGEVLFESFLKKLQNNYLVLNDLFLQTKSNHFQLDSLMITNEKLFLFEVKNHEGDYVYDEIKDGIFSKTNEILNPYSQVVRAETLLRQLLYKNGIRIPIESAVIFINPEFTLYNAPKDKPYIYPTQIHRYLKRFDKNSTHQPNKNSFIAEKLLSLHTSDSQYWQIPAYEYEQLRKGVTCASCHSFNILVKGQSCVCMKCGHCETVSNAVVRCIREYKLLFPKEKIITNTIFDWCGGLVNKKLIYRILRKNFKIVGNNRWVHYV